MRFKFWTNMSILFESHLSLSIRSTDSGWAFALLPEKARTTYIRTFDTINGIQPNLAPDTIMVDFELALHRSISDAFPATYLRGCLFLFAQCINRKIQQEAGGVGDTLQ